MKTRTSPKEIKNRKFIEFSYLFRKKLKEKKISFPELLKRSRAIREEIYNEKFKTIQTPLKFHK